MAFISNKERNKRVRQSNQSYGLRKLFISLTVVALCVLVIFAIVTIINFINFCSADSGYVSGGGEISLFDLCNKMPLSLFQAKGSADNFETGLSPFGWFMTIWSVVTLALAIVSLVLMLTMKSPKQAKKNINVLQGAAISGKKLAAHANATQVYRERGMNTKKLKASSKKKK